MVPEAQRRGVGQALIRAGIAALKALDVGLVFVLGHIACYPRAGFRPALPFGLRPPCDIDPSVADAWMVQETRAGLLGTVRGVVHGAGALMRPELKCRHMLRHDEYLAAGLPIATGVIEGAGRHLVKDRMDLAGARWRLRSAEAVLQLRSLYSSGDYDAYWEFHKAQALKRNHPAPSDVHQLRKAA